MIIRPWTSKCLTSTKNQKHVASQNRAGARTPRVRRLLHAGPPGLPAAAPTRTLAALSRSGALNKKPGAGDPCDFWTPQRSFANTAPAPQARGGR